MSARPESHPAAAEMTAMLDRLASFTESGPGMTRLLYTPPWREAQSYLMERMAELGFETAEDAVGNVYGRVSGIRPEEGVILSGSHIDTVAGGGRYDGAYGVAAAVAAISYLRRVYGPPLRTLEAASFCEEEGSRFPLAYWGSGHVNGVYSGGEADCRDADGVTLKAAMAAVCRADAPAPYRSDIAAYAELHIEQGILLERTRTPIGIVTAIVGQRRYGISVGGTANHAGTTPMGMRRDALAGAAEMIAELERSALAAGEPLVATTGHLSVTPNTPNVIPGEVRFTLDIRHSDDWALDAFSARTLETFAEVADRRGLELSVKAHLAAPSARMDEALCERLERICRADGLPFRRMVSGAGHDAQLFAPRVPSCMIFVPSRGGVSHSPDEYTGPAELEAGLGALTALLYELAYRA